MAEYMQGVPDFDKFKILKTGTTTLASPNSIGGTTSTNITHGFNYIPTIWVFMSFSSTGTRFPLPYLSPQLSIDPSPGLIAFQINYEVLSSIITIYWRDISRASNLTAYIRYYVVEERAS